MEGLGTVALFLRSKDDFDHQELARSLHNSHLFMTFSELNNTERGVLLNEGTALHTKHALGSFFRKENCCTLSDVEFRKQKILKETALMSLLGSPLIISPSPKPPLRRFRSTVVLKSKRLSTNVRFKSLSILGSGKAGSNRVTWGKGNIFGKPSALPCHTPVFKQPRPPPVGNLVLFPSTCPKLYHLAQRIFQRVWYWRTAADAEQHQVCGPNFWLRLAPRPHRRVFRTDAHRSRVRSK